MIQFREYIAVITFNDRCVGGIPAVDPAARIDAYRGWLKGQGIEGDDNAELTAKLAGDPDMPTASPDDATFIGFRSDENGLYIEARQIKAMLKETAQRLGIVKQVRGSRQVLQHDLHVRGSNGSQKIHLGRGQADGTETRPISVVTPQGPRTSIKAFEYVTGASISFRLLVLAGGVGDGLIGEDDLRKMLELGQYVGIGADRSQGEGTFTLDSFTAVTPSEEKEL